MLTRILISALALAPLGALAQERAEGALEEIIVTASALPGQRVSVGVTVPVTIVMLDEAGNYGTNVIAVTGVDVTAPQITVIPPDLVPLQPKRRVDTAPGFPQAVHHK